eukprot:CAMPEP_0198149350 /NCGR_PEP_ID=MMETSP1443-20131203/46128_1 /TAXON_ID=186043 /ORGANISM="Entomoneis sp., Strain CCMP2396" /LENGTH=567 /DNA_ID=CAMNT_0043814353 /DNA_START=206 /DNA_END=1906 /DNA_ORIENTATION=-
MAERQTLRLTTLLCVVLVSSGFTLQQPQRLSLMTTSVPTTGLEMAKSRKARRSQKVEKAQRPKSFYEVIENAQSNDLTPIKEKNNDPAEADRQAKVQDAQRRMDSRPDVSTILVDEESGMEIVQQGKNVMDVITRRAVKLSDLGADYRLAQMFPGVPPAVREDLRLDAKTFTIPEMVEKLRQACSVKLEDGSVGIPPHPSVADKAIDFVLANRDLLGHKMKKTLGRMAMRSFSSGNTEEGQQNQKLWRNYLTLENHISAPFRQMKQDAEGRAGPNFGNLEVKSYLNGPLYERTANYLVLKGMVAHWEKKLVDADSVEKVVQSKENFVTVTSIGDPRRYLPDSPILYTLKECTQVCYMAQQTTKAFVETPELFNDLPPEVRFLEYATSIKGGTPMRKFMKDDFCPAEGITPEALREGMKRLMAQLENMQTDPYADIVNTMEKLIGAMSVGSDDERDPYAEYLLKKDPSGPGRFKTYTFNHDEQSLVRFFDSSITSTGGKAGGSGSGSGGLAGLFNFGGGGGSSPKEMPNTAETYKVPPARAAGRPHELGWLEKMQYPEEKSDGLSKMK